MVLNNVDCEAHPTAVQLGQCEHIRAVGSLVCHTTHRVHEQNKNRARVFIVACDTLVAQR